MVIGQNATDNSQLTVANGTLRSRDARIAATGGSQGMLTVAGNGILQIDENLIVGGGQGTLQVESGGVAQVDGILTALINGRITGAGTIQGEIDNQAGTIAPGFLAGQLSIVGAVTQGPTALLEIELGGTDNSDLNNAEYDTLAVDGVLDLNGTLSVSLIDLGGGVYAPADGDMFEIATATGGITGGFTAFDLPVLAGLSWLVGTDGTSLLVGLTDSPADFTNSSAVSGQDFLAWQRGFGIGTTPSEGDSDGDGDVDSADLANWMNQYGFRLINDISPVTAVPEPSSVFLISLGLVALFAKRFPAAK